MFGVYTFGHPYFGQAPSIDAGAVVVIFGSETVIGTYVVMSEDVIGTAVTMADDVIGTSVTSEDLIGTVDD